MSGAAVVLFQHARRADGGYSLKLQPALDDFPSKDATADTAHVMAGIEAMARTAPAQYLWIHRRFKRPPDGVSPYASHPCRSGFSRSYRARRGDCFFLFLLNLLFWAPPPRRRRCIRPDGRPT